VQYLRPITTDSGEEIHPSNSKEGHSGERNAKSGRLRKLQRPAYRRLEYGSKKKEKKKKNPFSPRRKSLRDHSELVRELTWNKAKPSNLKGGNVYLQLKELHWTLRVESSNYLVYFGTEAKKILSRIVAINSRGGMWICASLPSGMRTLFNPA